MSVICCFLCHGMVQIIDNNPSDFTNHMITQHKAFFNMELSLACSFMDETEIRNINRQHIILNINITKEDEELLKEVQIKQENFISMEEDTNINNKSDILEGEYTEDIVVKEETTTQENSAHKTSPTEDKIQQESSVSMVEGTNIDKQNDILAGEYIEDEDILVKEEETTNDNSDQKRSPLAEQVSQTMGWRTSEAAREVLSEGEAVIEGVIEAVIEGVIEGVIEAVIEGAVGQEARGKKRKRGVGNVRVLNSRKKQRRRVREREILAFMGTWWYGSIEEL